MCRKLWPRETEIYFMIRRGHFCSGKASHVCVCDKNSQISWDLICRFNRSFIITNESQQPAGRSQRRLSRNNYNIMENKHCETLASAYAGVYRFFVIRRPALESFAEVCCGAFDTVRNEAESENCGAYYRALNCPK